MPRSRSRLLALAIGIPLALLAASPVKQAPASAAGTTWHEVTEVEGKGWAATKHRFDRLPAKAEGVVREPVWSLSNDSSGLGVRFETDSPLISVRWALRKQRLEMPHMAATGVSGVDLYIKDGASCHFVGVGQPRQFPANEEIVAAGLPGKLGEYRLNFPLYNGVDHIEIGVAEGTKFRFLPADAAKPVVFYGTSITQGGCAARPGMAYPAILSRRLGVPAINLGFSGNAKTEPEVATLLAELDPAVFVLDSLPNLSTDEVAERIGPFLETIRKAHPDTPIVLVENLVYAGSAYLPDRASKVQGSNKALNAAFKARIDAGDKHLTLVPAKDLIGLDDEGTVDGSHPTDLGFVRIADALEPFIRHALADQSKP
ncbi:SGNH/GDSL hydrolase family protein [Isosphaeraceae bacterium EP7]